MPLAKTYKRYEALSTFGVIGSTRCNLLLLDQFPNKSSVASTKSSSIYGVTGALENVVVWDVRKAEKVCTLKGKNSEITSIAKSSSIIAAGFNDGSVKLWDLKTFTNEISFSGHKSAVTCLSFDHNGTRLVSGSSDTEVIVWDIVGERGLYRLKGHKGMVTSCHFMTQKNVLITSSKDMLAKFWDLDTQHCFLTLVGHKSEIWQTCLVNNETRLLTGSGDSELRVYKIEDGKDNEEGPLRCELIGSIMRQGKGRVMTLSVDDTGRYIACHGTDTTLELYQIHSDEEIKHALHKRRKKLIKKQKKKPEAEQCDEIALDVEQEVGDEMKKIQTFQLKQKLRSCAIHFDGKNDVKLLLLYTSNSFGYYKVSLEEMPMKCNLVSMMASMGHRTDVRTLAFNSDATLLMSGSGECVKIWNRSSQKCIRTLESDYCLCSCFVPGDRHVIVGTKSGKLQLFDISSGNLLESVDAHTEAVWSIALSPDKNGFISGSADHDVKFWEFELVEDSDFSKHSKRLSMSHAQTLKMTEEVLAVKYSPDGRLLAVSLLDSTVKVFFSDTLKFFLSLYGHKFPVLCMDISLDNSLLITGSADKNIKIWGLDFGDCHKSIFAHDDSITSIQFVSKTHYFFSSSKDKTLKYWDADKFENIMTLQGHHAEIWSMAVSNSGEYVATGSHDKSIRLWQRTEELLVIEEEREHEREEADEMSMLERGERPIPGESEGEAAHAGKKTMETVKAAERIMEAIELYKKEEDKIKEMGEKAELHPILKAHGDISPVRYVLEVLKKVKSSELEESLLVLPFSYVENLLTLIDVWMKNSWEVEKCTRCLTFLLKIHHNQITSNKVLVSTIESLKLHTRQSVLQLKDQVGFNLAGLRFLQQQLQMKDVMFFEDATEKLKKKQKMKKIVAFT